MKPYTPAENSWTFRSIRSNYQRTTALELSWELNGDPISDDYTPQEVDARALMVRWLRSNPDRGTGLLPIYWSVRSTPEAIMEAAPLQQFDWLEDDFSSYFTRPLNARTGEPLNWLRLPVRDKLWTPTRGDKGGFIQSSTGWKPSPLQPSVPLAHLVAAFEAEAHR